MRSVISHLKGSHDFPRLRIGNEFLNFTLLPSFLLLEIINVYNPVNIRKGIGRPPGKMDSANFVLRPFNKKEREEVFPPILML